MALSLDGVLKTGSNFHPWARIWLGFVQGLYAMGWKVGSPGIGYHGLISRLTKFILVYNLSLR